VRLSAATLEQVPVGMQRFAYDRAAQKAGIVHFGIGAFHRAHQAWYTDLAMDAGDRDWGIDGISLRSPEVAEQMNPQDGLYTVTERDRTGDRTRAVGAVQRVLIAPRDPEAVIAALAAPGIHIVSFTVTEKGYCRAADGSLDEAQAGPGSLYHFVAQGLRQRRDAGLSGLTLLSCDNLADNGPRLAQLMVEYLDRKDSTLRAWFEAECTCPATMIDRIVPATTDPVRTAIEIALGLRDEAAVVTEPFSQWVIEDRFAGPRPAWNRVGAELVADVAPYENAKLRMLNGAHSALAYLGLGRGYTYVHEAIADPDLRTLIASLMLDEAAPTLTPAPGQDLTAYSGALLERFANPALHHRLTQIAMDGSQKIPQRWLATLADNRRQGRQCPALLTAVSAWLDHLCGQNGQVDDPRAEELTRLADRSGRSALGEALFGPAGLFADHWTITASDAKRLGS